MWTNSEIKSDRGSSVTKFYGSFNVSSSTSKVGWVWMEKRPPTKATQTTQPISIYHTSAIKWTLQKSLINFSKRHLIFADGIETRLIIKLFMARFTIWLKIWFETCSQNLRLKCFGVNFSLKFNFKFSFLYTFWGFGQSLAVLMVETFTCMDVVALLVCRHTKRYEITRRVFLAKCSGMKHASITW